MKEHMKRKTRPQPRASTTDESAGCSQNEYSTGGPRSPVNFTAVTNLPDLGSGFPRLRSCKSESRPHGISRTPRNTGLAGLVQESREFRDGQQDRRGTSECAGHPVGQAGSAGGPRPARTQPARPWCFTSWCCTHDVSCPDRDHVVQPNRPILA